MAQRPSTYVKCEDAPPSTTDERAGHQEPGYDGNGLWGAYCLRCPQGFPGRKQSRWPSHQDVATPAA